MDDALYNVLSYGVQYEHSKPVVLDALFASKDQDLLANVVSKLPKNLIDSLPRDFIGNQILDEANIQEEHRSDAGCTINIFKNTERFNSRKFALNQEHVIINSKTALRSPNNGKQTIVESIDDFTANFNRFSSNQLRNISWNNILVAGDPVLASLDTIGPQDFNNVFNFYFNSMIDVYLVGLKTKEDINNRIISLVEEIRKSNQSPLLFVRTAKSLIIVSEYPNKHININLQPFKSKEELLKDIDIDCSAVCYDGRDVFASPRFIRALTTRHMVSRLPENGSEISSEKNGYIVKQLPDKIFRMTQLGFNIVVPGLNIGGLNIADIVKPLIYHLEKNKDLNGGLLRLLYLVEKNYSSSNMQVFLPYGDGWNNLTMNQHLKKLFDSFKQFSAMKNIPYRPGFIHGENLELLLNSKEFSEVHETVKFDKSKWMKLTLDLEEVSKETLVTDLEKVGQLQKTVTAEYLERKDIPQIERAFEHIEAYKDIKKFVAKIDRPNQQVTEAIEGISNDIERVFAEEAKNTEYEKIYSYIKTMKDVESSDIQNATQIISAKQKDSKIALETKETEIRSLSGNLSETIKAKIKILEQLKRDETSLAKPLAKVDTFKATSSKVTSGTSTQNLSPVSIVQLVDACLKKMEVEPEENLKIEETNEGVKSPSDNKFSSESANPNGGDRCYVCKRPYMRSHQHYPKMCNECGEFNYQKRTPKVNLTGKIALVTGARVKIGYYTALMLLRNGATVIATTRFSRDAAVRFTQEPDYQIWKSRLFVYRIDFLDLSALSKFIVFLQNKFSHLDILINNAAQTIRRPYEYYSHMMPTELESINLCNDSVKELLASAEEEAQSFQNKSTLQRMLTFLRADPEKSQASLLGPDASVNFLVDETSITNDNSGQNNMMAEDNNSKNTELFPIGQYDEDKQQIDKRTSTSWVMKSTEISELEAAEVHVINALAPFLLVSKLKPLMMKSPSKSRYIINVSSPEGQFYKLKDATHPHTNMAKAALNMLTRTSADDYATQGIYMNAVDPGWVSLMQPHYIASQMSKAPLDNIDGAARILDPIIDGVNNGKFYFGMFFKDYKPTKW